MFGGERGTTALCTSIRVGAGLKLRSEMARTQFVRSRWALAVLALTVCFQMSAAMNCSDAATLCSSDVSSYSPQHFIFVHGMGGGAWFWYEIQTLMEHFNQSATAVDLTSHGINKAIADNVITVAEYTQPLIDAINNVSGKVILVGHSLGGGSIAYASELCPNKVAKAIYLSSCMPTYNQSMFSAFPANTFPNLLNAGYVTFNYRNGPSNPSSASLNKAKLNEFYMSGTPTRYVNLGREVMTDTPFTPGTETLPLTPAKYGTVRRFYIRTGKDKGVPPSDQDEIIANNPPEKLFCMPNGDHTVFFSAPIELFKNLLCISSL
uniref:AB hydrolase-1 domain-containing protein n=1 Tax=Physcomitrium patens TaxID=3218 RepID=A0A7I4E1E8_PHYPA|nr:putative methylesterase 11, chloroplastic isoform X1 [Physcomitrium patens]|eukprot:XP_024372887.1 putative methylesterase 11, chloroplastic isoform X1 [Physcomitrella patens]